MTASEHTCPLCQSHQTSEFLRRQDVPVHQNYLIHSEKAAEEMPAGDLVMHACTECGFVFNDAFDPDLIVYGESYENNQSISGAFSQYIDSLISKIIDDIQIENSNIIELGCGNGEFLRRLIEKDRGNKGLGFDPAYRGTESEFDGRISYHREYYGENSVDIPADVIVCRHVIEHIQDPLSFLKSVRKGLAKSSHARLFFETPCVEWILKNQVTWDFFYEHCSLFTAESLTKIFQLAGFEVTSVEHTFGGQYLWLEAKVASVDGEKESNSASDIAVLAAAFHEQETKRNLVWQRKLRAFNENGPVALWGAGAKGVTFANMVDSQRQHLAAVVDINPNKQSMFLPGTGHPIIAPESLGDVKTVVVLNPNYCDEIAHQLKTLGLDVHIVDLSHEDS